MSNPTAAPKPALPSSPPKDAPFAEWALWCAEIGRLTGAFRVFPCVPGEKRPLHGGWQDEAACDPKTVEVMWVNDPQANIGLAIQPGFLAIDSDIYKPGCEAKLDAFEAEHGELPRTLESRSARGGYQLIYSTKKAFGNGTGSLPDFGDVRGHGGLIVGPGSIFKGNRYTVENLGFPVALPAHIEAMLCESKRRDGSKPDGPVRFVVVDDPHNVEFFANWCAGRSRRNFATPDGEVAKPCIEHQGGNNVLAATGAVAHDYGLSEDKAAEIALEHFNPRCEPPWDDDVFDKHFRSGYRSANGPLGSRAPARDYSGLFSAVPMRKVTDDDTQGETGYGKLVSQFEALLSARGNHERIAKRFGDVTDAPQVPWIIPGWLSQNAAWIMYGESGSFKTYITLNMLLCVATGTPWAARDGFEGYAVGAPRPVILFAGESHSGVVQRVHAAIEGGGFDRKLVEQNLVLVPDVYALNHAEGLARMADEIQALGIRPAIIAVDTLNLALDGNEDSSDEIKRAFRGLRALAIMFGAAALAIDHVGHGDKTRPRGSSAKKANCDGMILCERHGDAKSVSLTQHKNRDDDQTKHRAAFAGKIVDLGVNPKTGEPAANLFFSATDPGEGASPKSKSQRTDAENKIVMATVARAVLARLEANPTRAWSHSALADAVATDGTIIVGGSMLRQRYLKSLREDRTNPVSQCYDPETGRWRYRKI